MQAFLTFPGGGLVDHELSWEADATETLLFYPFTPAGSYRLLVLSPIAQLMDVYVASATGLVDELERN